MTILARLACLIHVANVHSEPGSNPSNVLCQRSRSFENDSILRFESLLRGLTNSEESAIPASQNSKTDHHSTNESEECRPARATQSSIHQPNCQRSKDACLSRETKWQALGRISIRRLSCNWSSAQNPRPCGVLLSGRKAPASEVIRIPVWGGQILSAGGSMSTHSNRKIFRVFQTFCEKPIKSPGGSQTRSPGNA